MLSLWSFILVASVAIGLFFLSLLLTGRKTNPQATYLFSGLLLILAACNADNWLYASGTWLEHPMLVGFSRASILLIDPLIYLYSKSIVLPEFRLAPIHLLHLVPYVATFALIFRPLFLLGEELKLLYIRQGFESTQNLHLAWALTLAGYVIHLTTYLVVTLLTIRRDVRTAGKVNFITSSEVRLRWLKKLTIVFSLFLSVLAALFVWTAVTHTYRLEVNIYLTTAYSIMIYYLGFHIVRNEHAVLPGFDKKYRSLNLADEQRNEHLVRLTHLVHAERIFLDPDLTLARLAGAIGLPPGQLSRLINEEYDQSFPDFINHFRVEEVKKWLKDPKYDSFSILGIAMEVGFNSKSSFNSAFKKFTGMTPSDYKSI